MRYRIIGMSTGSRPPKSVEEVKDHYKLTETIDGGVMYDIIVDTENQKNILLDHLKGFVDESGGVVNCYECAHDGTCVIAETYKG